MRDASIRLNATSARRSSCPISVRAARSSTCFTSPAPVCPGALGQAIELTRGGVTVRPSFMLHPSAQGDVTVGRRGRVGAAAFGGPPQAWSCEDRPDSLDRTVGDDWSSRKTYWPQQGPVPDSSRHRRAAWVHGPHSSATQRRVFAGMGPDRHSGRGDDDGAAGGVGAGDVRRQVASDAGSGRAGPQDRPGAPLPLRGAR